MGEVNSQVRMTEEDIEAAFVDLKELLGSSEVCKHY